MRPLPFRAQQWLISAIGSALLIPFYLFWGGVFTYSFSAYDSIYAWGFGLVACWSQVMAMLCSFFTPRKAAFWMMINVAVGILLGAGHYAESLHGHISIASRFELWLHEGRVLYKAIAIFWAPPLVFAALLLRPARPLPKNVFFDPAIDN